MMDRDEETKTDRRITKTKRAIYNAIAQLLVERELENITIKELTELADINRKTFYNYYKDLNALIDEIEGEISAEFDRMIDGVDLMTCLSEPEKIYDRIRITISKREDFYGNLFRMKKNRGLVTKFSDTLIAKTKEVLREETSRTEIEVDVVSDYIISGMINVYQRWFSEPKELSMDQLSKIVAVLVSGSLEIFNKPSDALAAGQDVR